MVETIKIIYSDDASTEYSPRYRQRCKTIRTTSWYDIRPYSQTLWAHSIVERTLHDDWWCKRNNIPWMCIEYIISGSLTVERENSCIELNSDDLFITYPGDALTIKNSGSKPVHQFRLMLSGGCLRIMTESLGINDIRHFHFSGSAKEELIYLCNTFFEVISKKKPDNARINSQKAYELLLLLAESCTKTESLTDVPLFSKALRNMECNLESTCSVQKLAQSLGISTMSLNRMFNRHLNTSPKKYWNKLRLERAHEQIANGTVPIKVIAYKLGFNNPLYFSTAFKKRFKLSPSECRKYALQSPQKTSQ